MFMSSLLRESQEGVLKAPGMLRGGGRLSFSGNFPFCFSDKFLVGIFLIKESSLDGFLSLEELETTSSMGFGGGGSFFEIVFSFLLKTFSFLFEFLVLRLLFFGIFKIG